MILFTRLARRRWLLAQLTRARAAWQALGRLWQAAFAAELDGHGEPTRTLRWQLAMARKAALAEPMKYVEGLSDE